MKSLFFLYGEKRTFETARKFWNILDIPNLDIVIHTPNTSSDYFTCLDFQKVTERDFDILGNPAVFLYDRDDYRKTDNHVLHYSYRFLSNYLKNIETIYDSIFIGRLDSTFYIENVENFTPSIDNYLFTLQPAVENGFIQEHAFFGSYEKVKMFLDNLPKKEYFSNQPHTRMSAYIFKNINSSEWEIFHSTHIRSNMVRYFELYINKYKKIKNIDTNYFNFIKNFLSKYEPKLDIEYKKPYRIDWMKDYKFEEGELDKMFLEFSKNV